VRITYLPVLRILRDLYLQPRDMQRFRTYVATPMRSSSALMRSPLFYLWGREALNTNPSAHERAQPISTAAEVSNRSGLTFQSPRGADSSVLGFSL
jgi:hypothetical protein